MTTPLIDVALLFGKLGLISFGGPAAHIALMETETVKKRGWLSREYFLDLLATTNLIPGPNSTEMASHIGYVHAGWPGLFVGGASFILPATVITLGLSWAYVRYGALPQGQALFYGINPVIIAIISTIAIFLPSFAIMSVVGPWIPRLRTVPVVQACLKGVNAAVVAAILSIVITLAYAAVVDVWTAGIAFFALLLLVRYRVETWQLVLGGAAIGVVHYLLG